MSAAATPLPAASWFPRLLRSSSRNARIVRFATIGTASTVLYWGLFLLAQPALGLTWATLFALFASTLANTTAQRRYTFCSAGETATAWRDHIASLAAFGGSWVLSVWALGILASLAPDASAFAQLLLAQACTFVGSAVRFSLLHAWNGA